MKEKFSESREKGKTDGENNNMYCVFQREGKGH